jgi:hypothetical protein
MDWVDIMTVRSRFYVQDVTEEAVFIVDLANECNTMSITNDAENVVANVAQAFGNKRIVYKDTMGQWDELIHENGVFVRFAPYRENGHA